MKRAANVADYMTWAQRRLRAALEKKGQTIGSMDLLIAAHAVSLDVRLVTHNSREFGRVPALKIEDWQVPTPWELGVK